MEMDHVEPCDPLPQGGSHPRRSIEPPRHSYREVPDLDSVERHGPAHRNGALRIHIRGEHRHLVPARRQCLAQAVDRTDRAAVLPGRGVSGDDVEDLHAAILRISATNRSWYASQVAASAERRHAPRIARTASRPRAQASMRSARGAASPAGTIQPFCPSRIRSFAPTISETITGSPEASASVTTMA